MSKVQQKLEAGMAALEAQRGILGNAVADAALNGVRTRLAALRPAPAAALPDAAQTLR